jgi:hypothetical protein
VEKRHVQNHDPQDRDGANTIHDGFMEWWALAQLPPMPAKIEDRGTRKVPSNTCRYGFGFHVSYGAASSALDHRRAIPGTAAHRSLRFPTAKTVIQPPFFLEG